MDRSKNNYWNGTGLFQSLADKVREFVPAMGNVEKGNPKLERFRKAMNAYYDIYNNGGCNRASSIRHYFKVSMSHFRSSMGREIGYITHFDKIYQYTDPVMDGIILDAALEQGLIDRAGYDRRVHLCRAMEKLTAPELDALELHFARRRDKSKFQCLIV